ncbi:MAG: divalent-cation tolerance protein CutA [Dehalococcoidia bacterium]|nr:divalent-cation tolerance protein CutA [Dehalococcoidia bacterium]
MVETVQYILVQITAGNMDEARHLAQLLLEQKKIACVNIIPEVESLFRWNGKIDNSTESLLLVKTQASLLDDIIAIVRQHHSYHLPEIIAIPLYGGSDAYLAWVGNETNG